MFHYQEKHMTHIKFSFTMTVFPLEKFQLRLQHLRVTETSCDFFFRFIFCRRKLKQIKKNCICFVFEKDVQTCKWHQCFLETHIHSLFQGGKCDKLNSRRNKQDIIWNATQYENVSSKGLGKVQRVRRMLSL